MGTITAAMVIVTALAVFAEGWPAGLRAWVQSKVREGLTPVPQDSSGGTTF